MINLNAVNDVIVAFDLMKEEAAKFGMSEHTLVLDLPVEQHMPAIVWDSVDAFGKRGHTVTINKAAVKLQVFLMPEGFQYICELCDTQQEHKALFLLAAFFRKTQFNRYDEELRAFVAY